MRHLAREVEPIAVRELNVESQPLAGVRLAGGIDEATAFGKVGDARSTAPASVPNGFERHVQTLLAAAVVHIQFWDLEQCAARTEVPPLLGDELILYHGAPCSNQN